MSDPLHGSDAARALPTLVEVWDAGGSGAYVFTDQCAIARVLRRTMNHCGTYGFRGRIVGWQFLVPKRLLSFYEILLQHNFGARFNYTQKDVIDIK